MQAGLPLLRCSTAVASSAAALKRRHKLSSSTAMDDGKEVPPAPAAGGLAERIMPHLLNMIVEYTVQENPTGPGKAEHYKVLGKAVELTTLIRLQVRHGKVVDHQDWWDKKPLMTRDTVGFPPLLGRAAEASRRGAMLLTHALMGFGKDPPAPPAHAAPAPAHHPPPPSSSSTP